MVIFFQQTILFALPLMMVALAGVFSERSGIINIALEGMMVFGAFIGVLTVRLLLRAGFTPATGQILLIIACIAATVGGGVFSLLLAFASINLKADQTIGGTALNLLAPAVVLFLILLMTSQGVLNISSEGINYNSAELFMLYKTDFGFTVGQKIPVFLEILINKVYPTTYYAIAIYIVLSIILYKTKFGLRLRSCGENPSASDSVGIKVNKMRYIGTVISGCLAGFGGFIYVLSADGCSSTGSVAGMGFLALAVMIFGNWKPVNIVFASLLFGALKCISVSYAVIDFNGDGIYWLTSLGISSHIYRIIPYVITLIVLAFTSKSSRAPKAEGIPYDVGKR